MERWHQNISGEYDKRTKFIGDGPNQTFQCDADQRVLLRPDDPDCSCFECTCTRVWGHKCLRRLANGEITKEYFLSKGGYNPLHVEYEERPDGTRCICEESFGKCACVKHHPDGDTDKMFCYHPKVEDEVNHQGTEWANNWVMPLLPNSK